MSEKTTQELLDNLEAKGEEVEKEAKAAKDAEELERLKLKADTLGVSYSPNIGTETLRNRIREHTKELEENALKSRAAGVAKFDSEEDAQIANRELIRKNAEKLIRITYTNMNPNKNELRGEFLTVANEYIGSITKFIPFGPDTPTEGYHVPYAIYKSMLEKEFAISSEVQNPSTGKRTVKTRLAKEYNIAVLPPLTEEELAVIAERQNSQGTV